MRIKSVENLKIIVYKLTLMNNAKLVKKGTILI